MILFEIDTNIPFTNKKTRQSKINSLPFATLEVGQSFHLAGNNTKAQAAKLSAWCQLAAKRFGRRFALRTVGDEDPRGPGLRIWRVEDKGHTDALFEPAAPEPVWAAVTAPVKRRQRKVKEG